MLRRSRKSDERAARRSFSFLLVAAAATACNVAGLGGALQLNITDLQTRPLGVRVVGPEGARLVEIENDAETEIGRGSAAIDRYVLQRATFGGSAVVGLFLCSRPCQRPLDAYLVAYSPDQLFTSSGELLLRFRIEPVDGVNEELSRTITAAMLPSLWDNPVVEVGHSRAP